LYSLEFVLDECQGAAGARRIVHSDSCGSRAEGHLNVVMLVNPDAILKSIGIQERRTFSHSLVVPGRTL